MILNAENTLQLEKFTALQQVTILRYNHRSDRISRKKFKASYLHEIKNLQKLFQKTYPIKLISGSPKQIF